MAYERRDSRGDFKGASHKQLISGTFTSHGNDPQLCNDEVRSGYVSRDRYTDQGRSESGSVQLYEQRSQSNYPTYGISNARDDNFSKGSDIPRYSREVEYEADGDPQAYRRGSITSIGNSENKAAKKIKQAEYAQYLVNQIQAREQKDGESRVGHSAPRKTSYDNRSDAGYPTTEETFDRNSSLTDKEGRYGTDLQLYQPSNDQDRYKSSTADKLYGGQEGIERLQHYSREQVFENGMSRQQRQSHQSQFRGRIVQDEELLQHQKVTQSSASSYNSPGHNPLGSGRFVEADVTDARPQDNVRGTGPTLSTAADYRREEIASKRAKQAEYAQSLHNQQQYRKQQEQQHHLSKANFLSTDIHDNSSYRNNPYNQNRRTDEAMSEKELKRAKQLEYAQALELQRMQQQQSPSSSSSAGSRSRRNSSPLSSKYSSTRDSIPFNLEDPVIASHRDRDRDKDRDRGGRLTGHDRTGRLEEGWTIGPIGQPVRKTLEVGHRGVQKAFNQSLNHCEAYGTQREERGGGGVEDNLSDLMNGRLKPLESGTPVGYDQYSQTRAQQQEQENPYTDNGNFSPSTQYRLMDDARGGGGGGLRDTLGSPKAHTFEPRTALDADVLDERKLKAKVMQSEQARALQQQMKDKAARAAAEKVKVEMDDLRESTRLEMERISMIKAYERDQQADKKNAVDENKSALLYQAEEKKGRKEIEERNELERERIDEMKMQDEREMVRRRELDEVERERNPRLRSPVVRTEEERMKYDKVSRAEEAFHAQSQARDSEMIESYTDMKRHPAGYSTRPTQSPFLLRQRDDLYDSNSPREKSKEKEVFEKSMRGTSRTESPGANTWNTDGRYDESEFDTSYRDISRDKEGRRVDRNRDSNSSNSHSNSDRSSYFPQDKRIGNERERRREKEMNESIVYPHQSSSSDAYNSRYVPTSTTWDRDKDRDRDNNRDRDRQRDKERERERERDRDYRGDDRSGEGGRGSQGRSHAPSRSTSSNYGNMKDEEVSKLDQTLVSDSRFVFPDGTSFASLKGVDTSELMQYSQFTTAQMPNKQNGTDVGQGTGSGLGTDRKSSKWGNYEDSRGGEDGREVDRNINRINDSKRDKDSDRERDRAVGEVRAMDEDDSAELLSYFEGMYTTKSRRTSTGTGTEIETSVPVVSRPLSILEERRITGDHSSLSRARGDSTVDSKTASGVTKPLREMAEANPIRNRDREREREGYGNGNGILGGGALSSSSSGQNNYNNRHGEGYSQSVAQPQLTRIMSGRSSGKEIERELMSPSKYHDDFEDEDEEDEDDNEIPEEDEVDEEEEEVEKEEDRVIEAVTRRKR